MQQAVACKADRCCRTPRLQVLSRRLYLPAAAAGRSGAELPKIVAVDLQPMAPIEGVTQLQVCTCLQLGHTLLLKQAPGLKPATLPPGSWLAFSSLVCSYPTA